MRDVKFSALFDKSMDHMLTVLFGPFRFKKWLRLVFIALLAGALFGSGGGGGGGKSASKDQPRSQAGTTADVGAAAGSAGSGGSLSVTGDDLTPSGAAAVEPVTDVTEVSDASTERLKEIGRKALAVWPVWTALGLALMAFFTWIWARFQFVWLNAVIRNETSIRAPFRATRVEGNSLFAWMFAFGIVCLAAVGTCIWLGIAPVIREAGAGAAFDWKSAVLGVLPWAGFLTLLFCFSALVSMYVGDFVVPMMAVDQARFPVAAGRFAKLFGANKKDLVQYLFFRLLLAVLALIVKMILLFVWLLIALLLGLLGALIVGLSAMLIHSKAVLVILGVALGVPILLAAILIGWMLELPFAVFFRGFSLHYLTSLRSGYAPLPVD